MTVNLMMMMNIPRQQTQTQRQGWRCGESTRLPPIYVARVQLPDSASYMS